MTISFVLYGVPYPGKSSGHFVMWSLIHSLLKSGYKISLCMMFPERDKTDFETGEGKAHMEYLKTICKNTALLSVPKYRDLFKKISFSEKMLMIFKYFNDPYQCYPEVLLKKQMVEFIDREKPDIIYVFDTGSMIALADYHNVPRMVVPGDPLFLTLKYELNVIPWREKFTCKVLLRIMRYLFIHKRLEKLVIDEASKYEWVGVYGDQHANWLKRNGVSCISLTPPIEDLCKTKNYSFIQTGKRKNSPIRILIFGRQDTTAGQNGLKLFIGDILPFLQTYIAEKKCEIHFAGAGTIFPSFKKKLEQGGCIMHGEINNIEEIFTESDIFLELAPYPVGMRTRVVTALSFGICIVAHSASKAGIGSLVHGKNCLLGGNSEQLVAHLMTCIYHAELREELGMNARKTYEEVFVPEKACEPLKRAIEQLTKK